MKSGHKTQKKITDNFEKDDECVKVYIKAIEPTFSKMKLIKTSACHSMIDTIVSNEFLFDYDKVIEYFIIQRKKTLKYN